MSYQLEGCIEGMVQACEAFGIPVISGNVSLYNETRGAAVWPTPVVGALGLIEEAERRCDTAFKTPGSVVVLIGASEVYGDADALAGSAYLEAEHGMVAGVPSIDLDLEVCVQGLCRRAVRDGLLESAHDCADGGLAVALAESCIAGRTGFLGTVEVSGRWDAALFGETQSRIVVSLAADALPDFEGLAAEEGVPWVRLGTTGGESLAFPGIVDVPLAGLEDAWRHGLERAVGWTAPVLTPEQSGG